MKILLDVDELGTVGRLFQGNTTELAGLTNDLRQKLATDLFTRLGPYELPAGRAEYEGQRITGALAQDVTALEQLTLEIERLWADAQGLHSDVAGGSRAVSAHLTSATTVGAPGAPGAAGAAGAGAATTSPAARGSQPDLWWFQGVPALNQVILPQAAPAAAAVPGAATGAVPGAVGAAPAAAPVAAGASGDLRSRIIATATAWIGTPYGWGGGHAAIMAPHTRPVDCSGLVHQSFGANGVSVSGTAASIHASMGTPIDISQALPGDLMFWGSPTHIHHIAIYSGGMKMIEAPHTGALVRLTNARVGGDYAGAKRVLT